MSQVTCSIVDEVAAVTEIAGLSSVVPGLGGEAGQAGTCQARRSPVPRYHCTLENLTLKIPVNFEFLENYLIYYTR